MSEAIEIIRLETEAIKALTAHIRAMVERLEQRRVVPEPVIEEVWDGVQSYHTKVRYPDRTWTIVTIPSGAFKGDYYVVSDHGDDLGEFEDIERAMQRIKDMEESK